MGTYPCSNCGATADTATGCPSCGRRLDAEIAEMDRAILSMQIRSKTMAENRAALMGRLQGAIATRALLLRAAAREGGTSAKRARIMTSTGRSLAPDVAVSLPSAGRRSGATTTTTVTSPAGAPPTAPRQSTRSSTTRTTSDGSGSSATTMRPGPAGDSPADTDAHPPSHPPETSPRENQNIVLGVGAVVMAIAVALTPFFYGSLTAPVRALILTVLTVLTIAAPIYLSRIDLVTTSEWISPLGLILILLDGRELWMAQVRHSGLSATTYAGLVLIVATLVAAGYQRVTGLAVPRLATIVLIQPIAALLLYPWLSDRAAWAAILALVAAIDLIAALRIHRRDLHGTTIRFAVRTLQELVNLGALTLAAIALIHAHSPWAAVRAGATVLVSAVVALAAALLFRQRPLADVLAGVAIVAVIGGFGRIGALAVPGWGFTAAALAAAGCAIGIYLLPPYARIGAQIGGGTATAVITIGILVHGWGALTAPVQASMPAWRANLDDYVATVTRGAGHHTGQLVPAVLLLAAATAIMLPAAWRRDCALIGVAVATILAPGAWRLPFVPAVVVCALIALLVGAFTLTARSLMDSSIGISAAFAIGAYATLLAIASSGGQALLLGVLSLGGAAIAAGGASLVRATGAEPDGRTIEAAWGGAAFALPGAIAAATAVAAPSGAIVAEAVISSTFVAVAATLTGAAITQVAWRRPIPLLVGGAALGALATAIASIRTANLAPADVIVSLALLASGVLLICAPLLNTGFRPMGVGRLRIESLDGEEVAAAAVTCASIAALARVTALVAPAAFLVIVACLVLLIAAGTRALPSAWRRGPLVGGGVVGALVIAAAGFAALDVTIVAARLNRPIWHVHIAGWADRLADGTIDLAHGPQALVSLLLIAGAGAIVLPRRPAAITIAVSLGLAALVAPATLHLGWWGPVLISGGGATMAGIAAAASTDKVIALGRGGVATLLFANTIAASVVASGTTAFTLITSSIICGAVTATGIRTMQRLRAAEQPEPEPQYLVLISGGALAGAVLALAGGTACLAATIHEPYTNVLTAAMAGLAIALVIIAPLARRLEPILPQVSVAISVGGIVIALAAFGNFTTAGVFASLAALLSIMAEVMRASVARARAAEGMATPVRRRVGIVIGWFPQRTEVLLAAGPATVLAVASVAPTIVAALAGPYRWIGMVWRGAPPTQTSELGVFHGFVGAPVGLLTAIVLTIMATVGVIGFGGSRDTVMARAVAVITPGLAICLLIAPYLLRVAWPAGSLAALAVAAISGLGLALVEPPADFDRSSPLRFARNLVVVICALSAGAGLAGSLAAQPMTISALTIATGTGAVAAVYGREQVSRVTGWIVTATAGQLLALVICLVGQVKPYDAAFVVGAVAAALLIVAALLPRLHRPENLTENVTVEVSAYAGAVLGLVLAARSVPHLAVFLGAWGAVLGIATARPERPKFYRSVLMWVAAAHELAAWFLLMKFERVGVPEAYTLGIAVIALITGWIELRWHPELTSWVSYGIALAAALGPSLVILIATGQTTLRLVLLLIAATAVLLVGVLRSQQAPTIIGGLTLLGATINLVARYSTTILVLVVLAIIAGVLIGVGASFEKQRRQLQKAWSVVNKKLRP